MGFYFEENNFIWTEISLYKSESDKMSYELIKEYAQKTFGTIHKLVYDILINCTFFKSYDIIQTRQSEGPLYEIHA